MEDKRLKQLIQLYPEVYGDGEINFNLLKELIGLNHILDHVDTTFTWKGKQDAIKESSIKSTKQLKLNKEKSLYFTQTQNIYIEGDNLEGLKILQDHYRNKIKMIYIDPPYNTGKSFIYHDDYVSTVNWLNMMYPRLLLARTLLTDDGVIFISIDDHEITNLRKICDEIFGEKNFVTSITNITGANQNGIGVKFQKNKEEILVYCKQQDLFFPNKVNKAEENLRNLNDAPTPLITRPDMGYTIYYHENTGEIIPQKDYDKKKIILNDESKVYQDNKDLINKGFIPIRPGTKDNLLHRWRWGYETFIKRKEEIVIKKVYGRYKVYFTQKGYIPPKNVLNFPAGTKELKSLFNNKRLFDFPKSVQLIKYLIQIGANKDSNILDFFSGSSTTAHAVMELNAEDHGTRRFILIQIQEQIDTSSEAYKAGFKTICEFGEERIRRASKRIQTGDCGFKVFEIE